MRKDMKIALNIDEVTDAIANYIEEHTDLGIDLRCEDHSVISLVEGELIFEVKGDVPTE